jgi:hypothetical protein
MVVDAQLKRWWPTQRKDWADKRRCVRQVVSQPRHTHLLFAVPNTWRIRAGHHPPGTIAMYSSLIPRSSLIAAVRMTPYPLRCWVVRLWTGYDKANFPAQRVRRTHLHSGEFHGSQLVMLPFLSNYHDPSFRDAHRNMSPRRHRSSFADHQRPAASTPHRRQPSM